MLIKKYTISFYNDLVTVWKSYGWETPVPHYLLPDGYVALTDKGTFIAAYFMYIAPGKGALLAWPVYVIKCTKKQKKEAFEKIIAKLKDDANKAEVFMMYAFSKDKHFKEILLENKIPVAEEYITSFALNLDDGESSFVRD